MELFLDVLMIGAALSWGQCLTFCAPIMLPYVAATQKGWRDGLKAGLAFSLARIIPYVIWCMISAALGHWVISRVCQSYAALVVDGILGAFLTLLGIAVLSGHSLSLAVCPSAKINRSFSQGKKRLFLLGLLTGFVPCVPLLGLLGYITFNVTNIFRGALLGLAFGMGTLLSPLLLFASLSSTVAGFLCRRPRAHQILSGLCGLMLLYSGVGMVMRVLF